MTEQRKARLELRIKNIEENLTFLYEAEKAVLSGAQQYSVGSRSLTRANLRTVQDLIIENENLLERLQSELNGGGRMLQVGVVPLDF